MSPDINAASFTETGIATLDARRSYLTLTRRLNTTSPKNRRLLPTTSAESWGSYGTG